MIKLGEKKEEEDWHIASSLKTRKMFLQDREELNYGAKCNGHFQDGDNVLERFSLKAERACR